MSEFDIEQLNSKFEPLQPKQILKEVNNLLPNSMLAFSGAEDVVLIDMAMKQSIDISVVSLDTGRLHPETYRFIEEVRNHYNIPIECLYPNPKDLEEFIKNKGLFSFYEEGHEECCNLRKVRPLQRKLTSVDAWITGQRQDQSPSRAAVPIIEIDTKFSTSSHQVIKVNPLSAWTSAEVWSYIRLLELPYNELHDKGMLSIGCEPCTRSIGPGQHEREGRWWWEEATIKECGLHLKEVKE
ncbi:MAG: phosphoadenylyl-sulfate reductase [Pseudohongiellaceae bacterium]